MIEMELLDKLEAFKGMRDEQLAQLKERCCELNFQRGDRLFKEGEPARHVWFVVDGQVDLRFELPDGRPTSSDQTVRSVEVQKRRDAVAQTLGWSCFVPPFEMRLSAYCVTRTCRIVRIEKEDLFSLFKNDAEMGYRFMRFMITVVGYRFHQFQDEVAKTQGDHLMTGW